MLNCVHVEDDDNINEVNYANFFVFLENPNILAF